MKCLQICLQGVYTTANRNLRIIGELPLQSYNGIVAIKRQLKNYRHRTWTHLCWSFSAITGMSKFYHDGILLGIDKVNVTENDYAIHGSDRMLNTSLIFGQEPDSFRGGFDKAQSYIGEVAEFNIWNYGLNGRDISTMASCSSIRNDGAWLDGIRECNLISLCTVCQFKTQPVFTVKGICYAGEIDWNFYPIIGARNALEKYEGYKKVDIIGNV